MAYPHINLITAFLASALAALPGATAVVRTSAYANTAAALAALKPGDALVFDGGTASATPLGNPPDNTQIIGGTADWKLSGDIRGVVFFNHLGTFTQTSGVLRRCQFYGIGPTNKFTGLDSCLILGPTEATSPTQQAPFITVDGFLRASTLVDFKTGFSTSGKNHSGLHNKVMVINATDPVGDGRGSLIANWLCWGGADLTNLQIINGRGIEVAHFNSEYGRWSDPQVIIENGAECALVAMVPGGYEPGNHYANPLTLDDGRLIYPDVSYSGAVYQIMGQHNSVIGGINYKSFVNGFRVFPGTGGPSLRASYQARDPFFSQWNPNPLYNTVNLGPALRQFGFNVHNVMHAPPGLAYTMGEAARCSTGFVDSAGTLRTFGLKPGSLPYGPKLYPHYFPALPKLLAGPGADMTGKSGPEIEAALAKGGVVYLGPGTYQLSGPVTAGTLWGAGMDATVVKCAAGKHCVEDGAGGAYNLTFQGGSIGYAQTSGHPGVVDFGGVRFQDMSMAGITVGNAQNVRFHDLEFVNDQVGVRPCLDNIPCGEDGTAGGGSMVDKVNFYMCTFRDMTAGTQLAIALNGVISFYGCRFENLQMGAGVWLGGSKCQGHHLSGCTFANCDVAAQVSNAAVIENCAVTGKGTTGFTGDLQAVINCDINGPATAAEVQDYAVVAGVNATGALKGGAHAWVAKSKFSNLDASAAAYYGSTSLAAFTDLTDPAFDATPPTAPGNVQVTAKGQDNVITWTASSDAESGVTQYIIERDGVGLEAGRTNYDWRHNAATAPGTYNPRQLSFTDPGAGAGHAYTVVALNGAQIRSDGRMANLRLTNPYEARADDDSVYTDPGRFSRYVAVDYSGHHPVALAGPGARGLAPAVAAPAAPLAIHDLSGRQLGLVPAGLPAGAWARARGLRPGLYVLGDGAGRRLWAWRP